MVSFTFGSRNLLVLRKIWDREHKPEEIVVLIQHPVERKSESAW